MWKTCCCSFREVHSDPTHSDSHVEPRWWCTNKNKMINIMLSRQMLTFSRLQYLSHVLTLTVVSLQCFSKMLVALDSVVCVGNAGVRDPPPCCHHFNWLVVHCLAAVKGEGQERTQRRISLVRLQKVSGGRSLGTKANMGALKLGNFSHNASLKADNRGESFGSDSVCCWNPRASCGAVRRLSDLGQSCWVDRD